MGLILALENMETSQRAASLADYTNIGGTLVVFSLE